MLPFHVMLKPRGALCNLDCAYCFYLSREQLYPGSSLRMSAELLESYTRQYIEAMRGAPEIVFTWQGGEPLLMGLDFFRQAVELQQRYAPAGVRIHNALQTNATLLNDDWARFFHEHHFLLGVSLDGPQQLHDAYRVDKGGRGSFERVMAGIHLLRAHQVEFNILACVNDRTAREPLAVYRFFRDEVGAKFIQFIPVVEKDLAPLQFLRQGEKGQWSEVSPRSVTGRAYGHFLSTIFDEWARRDVGQVFVQIFDTSLASWSGQHAGLCVFEPTCGLALALEHNGDLYACDHFVDPTHRLGNILETPLTELVTSPPQRAFGRHKLDDLPAVCRTCPVRFACNGGCPKDWLPDGKGGLRSHLCQGYLAFYTHIDRPMRVMATLLRQGRAPAEIMRLLAFEESARQAGPQGACPCGSGKAVQDCHPAALQDPILPSSAGAGRKKHKSSAG